MEKTTRKELEKNARKQDILEAALHLFAAKGFHEVTVDEIAERVGLSKGTLYLYFKNKEDLFFSIIQEKTDALFTRLQTVIQSDAPYLDRLEGLIRVYLSFFDEHKAYFKIIHSEKIRMDDQSHYRLKKHMAKSYFDYDDFLEKFMREGQKLNIYRALDAKIITHALRGLLNSFTFRYIFSSHEGSLTDDTPYVLDLLLNGVKNRDE